MSILLWGGALLAVWGIVEIVLAVTGDHPRHQIAQGMFFLELGLAFVVSALLPEGLLRTSLAGALALSAIVSAGMQHRLMRAERRKRAEAAN